MAKNSFVSNSLSNIFEKIQNSERLTFEEGLELYRIGDLFTLGRLASIVRKRLHGPRVFYAINLHLHYTNICAGDCSFCSFSKKADEKGAYTLSLEKIEKKVKDALTRFQINEVHIVGGHNPALRMDYYVEMIRRIRNIAGPIYIKAFSAPEIDDLAKRMGLSPEEVLKELKGAGLDGLPGGGAEIFASKTRKAICPQKITADHWLEIHRIAHHLGLNSNATMLYGHIETDEDRVDHVLQLRELQDETRGFCSFVPLSYNVGNNPIGNLGEKGGILDLKVLAISRLLLDNISHIKTYWRATDLKLAQVALSFGADDFGGIHLDEKIMQGADSITPSCFHQKDLEKLISDAGYEPCLVDSSYQYSCPK